MLRSLEKATGLKLTFKKEILDNRMGLNTVLFELISEEKERYIFVVTYDCHAEAALDKLRDTALWIGNLFARKVALFLYSDETITKLCSDVFLDEKANVEIFDKDAQPDFSLCRFTELYPHDEVILLRVIYAGETVVLPVRMKGDTAYLGTWMSSVSRAGLLEAVDYTFSRYKKIKRIEYKNTPYSVLLDAGWRHNDYYLPLPNTIEQLDSCLSSRTRSTIRREIRKAKNDLNGLSFSFVKFEDTPEKWVDTFYAFKKKTHGTTKEGYSLLGRGVTDSYAIITGNEEIDCVLFSCENGEICYAEAFAFNSSRPKYSFGKIMLDYYYKELINRGKSGVGLGGGNHDFKSHYGTICFTVWSGSISRNAYRTWRVLQALGMGNKPLSIRRWIGRAEYIESLIKRQIK